MMSRQARRSGLVMGFDTHMIAGGRACSTSIPPTTSQTSPHFAEALSNGPTEAMNLLIKKVKRVGHGFRNFTNYRLRLLLHCGIRWQTHRTARWRGRHPRLVA